MEKILKKILVSTLIFTLAFTGLVPIINAQDDTDSFTGSSVTTSDSAPDATGVTYTFSFTNNEDVPTSGDIRVSFPESSWISEVGDIACPEGSTGSTTDNHVYCEEAVPAGEHELVVENVAHPSKEDSTEGSADTYIIELEGRDASSNVQERAQVMTALVEPVTVRATVDASLNFDVTGVSDAESLHGGDFTTDFATEATRIPFGVLEPDSPKTAAQDLTVSTNASDGFTVTVHQDGNLVNADGDEITSFKNGYHDGIDNPEGEDPIATSDVRAWESPAAVLDDPQTYGHFGFTSEDLQVADSCLEDPDSDGTAGAYFEGGSDSSYWAGFKSGYDSQDGSSQGVSDVEEIMCHVGPSDGETEHKGTTRVGFRAEISTLQPAGEYRNTLTYIATPTF